MEFKRHIVTAVVALSLAVTAGESAFAQSTSSDDLLTSGAVDVSVPERANTIGVVADEAASTSMQLMSELAAMAASEIRLVPVAGLGPLQNLTDLLHLKGVDAAITQTDVLDFVRREKLISDIDKRLRFIARLHNREVHLIARSDQADVASLRGKRVNIGPAGSGTAVTASAILKGIGLDVIPTTFDHKEALHLITTGQVEAMFYVGGKPVPLLENMDPADGLKLLPVPFTATLQRYYRLGQFEHSDYPGLLLKDTAIETVSVGAAIVAFNWPKGSQGYVRLERLAQTLFDNIAELQKKPRHDKWRTVNLAAALPGWQRHGAAQAGLARQDVAEPAGDAQIDRLRASFKAILHAQPAVEIAEQ